MTTPTNLCRKENSSFSFIWKIQNVSQIRIQHENFDSPRFKIKNFRGEWYLKLVIYWSGSFECECRLVRSYENTSHTIKETLFCVQTTKGELLYEVQELNLKYTDSGLFQKRNECCVGSLEPKVIESVPDDTILIHLHIRDDDQVMNENPMHCFAATSLRLQRRVFYWKVNDFSSLQLKSKKEFNLHEVKKGSLTFTLFLVGLSLEDASVQILINFKDVVQDALLTCAISVMDEKGTAKKYMQDQYRLRSSADFEIFPPFLTRRELIASGLHNDTLLLRGEVTLSGENNGLEQVVYGLTTEEAVGEAFGSISRPSQEHVASALSADMLSLFKGSGPPSDFELRVEGRTFPVHQLVLGTRSAVFRAMFDNGMLEQSTKSVELTDLDVGTAERLLKFTYADVEPSAGLSWEPLASLYSAADKYEILALRKICARRLVQLLDLANAPKILQLADRHRDSHLKEDVIDYLFKRGRAVLQSDQWKSLEQDDPQLAVDTLRRIFCEKVLIQPLEFQKEKK